MVKTRSYLTAEQRVVILRDYPAHGAKAVAERLGVPKYRVKNLVHRHKLKRDPAHTLRKPFTEAEMALIDKEFPNRPTKELASATGRSVMAVAHYANSRGMKKSAEFLASELSGRLKKGDTRGAKTRFKPGHPSNKGKKMTPQQYAAAAPTMFKKGSVPHNTKTDGHISVRRDADGRQYFWVRLSLNHWLHLHRYLWEQKYGPVPEGHVITFKDGNQGNCVIENLECVTEGDRMRRTSIMNYPPDIRNAMWLLGRLKKTIQEHGQEHAG